MTEQIVRRRQVQHPPLDAGYETRVFAHQIERVLKSGNRIIGSTQREGRTVLKNYNFSPDSSPLIEGFNEKIRGELDEHYQALCAQYGKKFFPRQRFLNLLPHPTDKKRALQFVLVQERMELDEPADIFDYSSEKLPDPAKDMTAELVAKRKESYQHYLQDPSDEKNRSLDLMGHANVVVCADGSIKYLDTSSKRGRYSDTPFHIPIVLGTTAMLEIVASGDPQAVMSDPFYEALVQHPRFVAVAKLADDPRKFFSRLRRAVGNELYSEKSDQLYRLQHQRTEENFTLAV